MMLRIFSNNKKSDVDISRSKVASIIFDQTISKPIAQEQFEHRFFNIGVFQNIMQISLINIQLFKFGYYLYTFHCVIKIPHSNVYTCCNSCSVLKKNFPSIQFGLYLLHCWIYQIGEFKRVKQTIFLKLAKNLPIEYYPQLYQTYLAMSSILTDYMT